jgi:hypothetical protein
MEKNKGNTEKKIEIKQTTIFETRSIGAPLE